MLCLGAYLRVRPVIELHLRTLTNGTDDKRNARSLGRVLARLPERSPEFAVWEGRARVSPAAALPLGQALLEPPRRFHCRSGLLGLDGSAAGCRVDGPTITWFRSFAIQRRCGEQPGLGLQR